jgi:hypothetical protein
MTFTEIVDEVLARTRQTSPEASDRIGRAVNDRNRRVTSSIGMATTRRVEVPGDTVVGIDEVDFDLVKILAVFIPEAVSQRRVLREVTFDEWRGMKVYAPSSGPPTTYAIGTTGPSTVQILIYPTPDAIYTLGADGLDVMPPLSGAIEPPFTVDFHDILMHGALADEWMQLKQDDLSKRAEQMYEQRLAEYRMFIAKSAYLDIHQGKRGGFDRGPYWPGYYVQRWWW